MPTSNVSRRRAMLALSASAAAGLQAACASRAREAPRRVALPIEDGSWRDATRQREIPWRLRWPPSTGPAPQIALVVYSHGLGGNREGGDAWGEAWRDAGFAVLHLQHPGSDSSLLREGSIAALRAGATPEQLMERARDVRFALTEIERRARAGVAPWSRVRADAIGMAGHSFGAITTQAVAGQRYPVATDLADARPRAFIALSASSARAVPDAFAGITRPFCVITGSLDGDPFGSFDTGEPRARVYEGLPPGQRALLWLDGADHMTFGGNREQRIRLQRQRVAREREDAHHALVARITTDWWRAQLLGDERALAALRAPVGLVPPDRFTFG
jgi:predicted dienelactone hydrolase